MLSGSCHCGQTGWTLEGDPGAVTACNCTLCRRYGALWAYDYVDERISLRGASRGYSRLGKDDLALEILFCPACACVLAWRGLRPGADGPRRVAVNLRLTEPEAVSHLPISHFDGLNRFMEAPSRGLCVGDLWA